MTRIFYFNFVIIYLFIFEGGGVFQKSGTLWLYELCASSVLEENNNSFGPTFSNASVYRQITSSTFIDDISPA